MTQLKRVNISKYSTVSIYLDFFGYHNISRVLQRGSQGSTPPISRSSSASPGPPVRPCIPCARMRQAGGDLSCSLQDSFLRFYKKYIKQ
jgi:hypothetical protein